MAATVERDPASGRLTAIQAGAGPTRETFAYSNAFRELSGQTATHAGAPRYAASYQRDALGRITSRTESVNGQPDTNTTYTYDAQGRLTNATVDGTPTRYTWDRNGNRTSGGATYDAQDRLTGTAGVTCAHTPAGRLQTRTDNAGTTAYTYDAKGALRAVDLPNTGNDIAYGIDGLGRRLERRVGGNVTQRWLYDPAGRIVAELDAGNDLVATYAYLPGDNAPILRRRNNTTYRLVTDPVGSVRLVIDTTDGSIAQRIDYDPFGTPTYTGPQPAGFIPFGFAAGHYDPATGLDRIGARDYDPQTGRFTSKDPTGFASLYKEFYALITQ